MARVAGLALATLGAGCKGTIVVPPNMTSCKTSAECGQNAICDTAQQLCVKSPGPCSPQQPDGDCDRGLECRGGICMCVDAVTCGCSGECPQTWCNAPAGCSATQACDNGRCVEVTSANDCDTTRPEGYCDNGGTCCENGTTCCGAGDLCVGNHCVPDDAAHSCSATVPNGWCPPDLSCVGGRCEQYAPLYACSATSTGGLCDAGQTCDASTGQCKDVQCAPGTPVVLGGCPAEQVCTASGTCADIPCSPGHLAGPCPVGDKCSKAGSCIPSTKCLIDADCPSTGQYCSSTQDCKVKSTCGADADCTLQYGQGYQCVGGSCSARTTCPNGPQDCIVGDVCSVSQHCLKPPACETLADCASLSGTFCSVVGICIDSGTCKRDADCQSGQYCSGTFTCLPVGACVGDNDCPPAQTCTRAQPTDQYGSCVANAPGTCTSNEFVDVGCAPGQVTCCAAGQTCCPTSPAQHCSAATNCIAFGKCVNDSDCLAGYSSCIGYTCVPTKACSQCTSTEQCATVTDSTGLLVNGCVPAGRCFSNKDCTIGEECDASFHCQPGSANVNVCSNSILDAGGVVPPNVMIVVDKSGSMNICGAGDPNTPMCGYSDPTAFNTCTNDGDCTLGHHCYQYNPTTKKCLCDVGDPALGGPTTSRWDQAKSAINYITGQFSARINFGLSIYPKPAAGESCPIACNWFMCSPGNNTTAGVIDAALGATPSAISTALAAATPNGGTPTAPTLRNIVALPDHAGLTATDRANAVLLVTDGEATGDLENSVRTRGCLPAWQDGTKDGDETDVDCGGSSPPCMNDGMRCKADNDCWSHVCRSGECRPDTCTDGVQGSGETDVDCGGTCAACADGKMCVLSQDCMSGICTAGICGAASCSDSLKNGSETDTDCGGACPTACAVGQGCSADADCASAVCQAGVCRASTCAGNCGGTCAPCTTSCTNGLLDAGETDVDCGGSCAAKCGPYHYCSGTSDCVGGATAVCQDFTDTSGNNAPMQAALANAAIGRLYSDRVPIRTFVVGFNLVGGTSPNLNCHAAYGHTARRDQGDCATTTSVSGWNSAQHPYCSSATGSCYYQATSQNELQGAFNDILGQVSACSYMLTGVLDPYWVFVYLQDVALTCGPGGTVAEGTSCSTDANCGGAYCEYKRTRLDRYSTWDLGGSSGAPLLNFFGGPACDALKTGKVKPLVLYGCPGGPA